MLDMVISFIVNNEGGKLSITNSSFTNMQSYESGSVIQGGYQNSQTMIHDTVFENNTATYGGVASIQSNSVIKFYDCQLSNNFGVQGGIVQNWNDGYFEMYR